MKVYENLFCLFGQLLQDFDDGESYTKENNHGLLVLHSVLHCKMFD
jgi:hypothetical protein